MRAWLLESQTGLGALRLAEVADPHPAEGQAILAVEFAGLNPADRYLAEGQYPAKPKFPHILGRDGIGKVVEVGAGASVSVGSKMIILRGETGVSMPGTFAEKVLVSAADLIPVPEGWSDQQAAGAPLVYLTAWQALNCWEDMPKSAVVLVTGASGGVGVASVQLARAMGHTVVALSRDPAKRGRLMELGARIVLDPAAADWTAQLRTALSGGRVDLAIDNIGGEQFSRLLETLGEHGRVSCVGRLAGEVPRFNTASLFFRRLRIGGVHVGAYGSAGGRDAWNRLVAKLAAAGSVPLVDSVHDFERLPEGFTRLAGGPMGKVLLSVNGAV
jgi:NADPH2:quinone reductase